LSVALALVGNLVTDTVHIEARWWPPVAWTAFGALIVAAVAVERRSRSGGPTPSAGGGSGLDDAADRLAHAVRTQWQLEEERRRVHDPIPLPVRWHPVAAPVVDHWANIRRAPARTDSGPLALAGQLEQIVEIYHRIPSGRLVVLGKAGSGKTVLTTRLALGLLATRASGDPVPVIISAAGWNPEASPLRSWLGERLVRDYPGLAHLVTASGESLAIELVKTGRILPILDGFDEIAAGLQRAALEQLNTATNMPLVLTSRTKQYTSAVTGTKVLSAAACIELDELTLADLAGYLPRTTTRRSATDDAIGAWEPVLRHLRIQPDESISVVLRAALSTPLMVYLARSIYSDTPDHDPAELLDGNRFPKSDVVQDHLLSAFIPAVYRRHRENGPRWNHNQAERWLIFLARDLEHRKSETGDLAWWRLRDAAPKSLPGLVVGLVTGVAGGVALPWPGMGMGFIVALLTALLIRRYLPASEPRLVSGVAGGAVGSLLAAFLALLMLGIGPVTSRLESFLTAAIVLTIAVTATSGFAAASVGAFIGETVTAFYEQADSFAAVRTTIGSQAHLINGVGLGLATGLAAGVFNRREPARGFHWTPVGFAFGMVCGVIVSVVVWLQAGVIPGLVAGAIAMFAGGFLGSLFSASAIDLSKALSPAAVLARDRNTFLAALSAAVPVGASFAFATAMSPQGLRLGLLIGVANAIAIGLGLAFFQTEWGAFALARWWMAIRRRLPFRLMVFLEDAHVNRGVLRQFGAVYQFRHAELQHHLATDR
jgi:hypothetical protein